MVSHFSPGPRRVLALLATLALAAAASSASASTLDMFGFGGRSPGLAGNGVATANDFDAVYINPAGLALIERTRIAIGALYGDLELKIDGSEVDSDPPLGTIIGAGARLKLGGILKDRISIGYGVFVPTAAITRARWPVTGNPVFALLSDRAQVVALQIGLGAKINDRLRVGASILGLAGLGGSIFVSTDPAGRFSAESEQTMIARFSPIVGAQYDLPNQNMTLGLVFRAESDATFEVFIDNDLINDLPLTIPPLNIGGTAQFDPLSLSLEGAWKPMPTLQLSGQVSYYKWSEFEAPTVNPVPGQPAAPEPGFHDTVVPRVSAEWRAMNDNIALDVRGGYSFVMSPAPEMDGRQSLLDNHRHVIAAGIGIAWPKSLPLRFDIWAQTHILMSRTHTKDPAKFGENDVIPFTQIETKGRVIVGGLTMGVEL